jgi:ADP-ribosylglycohydrolase
MTTTKAAARAVIYGLACGDALGWPTEFMGMDSIFQRYGKDGLTDLLLTKGEFTDDTQMTVALALGLLDAAEHAKADPNGVRGLMASPGWVMPRIAHRFMEWSVSPENDRAPGSSCMAGCRNLRSGLPWERSGVPTKGCGAVMRVAPIGLVYKDEETIKKIATASSTCTHDSEPARMSAYLGAFAIRLALGGLSADEIALTMTDRVQDMPPEAENLAKLVLMVPNLVQQTVVGEVMPWEAMDHGLLGQSWVADEALASALYCVCLAETRGEGYVEAVRYGANTPGDSDSIACIAGGIAGALWGLGGGLDGRGVPNEWIAHIEKRVFLGNLAGSLAALSEKL